MHPFLKILEIARKYDEVVVEITLKSGKVFSGEFYQFWGSPACIIIHLRSFSEKTQRWHDYFPVAEEIALVEIISPRSIEYEGINDANRR